MINIQTCPALSLKPLDIIIGLSTRLHGRPDFFSLSIRQAIKDNKPTKLIIETVKSAITDNPSVMVEVLGKNLFYKIINV